MDNVWWKFLAIVTIIGLIAAIAFFGVVIALVFVR